MFTELIRRRMQELLGYDRAVDDVEGVLKSGGRSFSAALGSR